MAMIAFLRRLRFFQSVVLIEDFGMICFSFDRGKRTLNEQRLDVNPGAADTSCFLLSRALIVLLSKTGSKAKVLGGREDQHIHTDFGDQGNCRKSIKAGNGTNKIDLRDVLFGD